MVGGLSWSYAGHPPEQLHLGIRRLFLDFLAVIQGIFHSCHHLGPVIPGGIKRATLNQTLKHPLIHFADIHPLAEFKNG